MKTILDGVRILYNYIEENFDMKLLYILIINSLVMMFISGLSSTPCSNFTILNFINYIELTLKYPSQRLQMRNEFILPTSIDIVRESCIGKYWRNNDEMRNEKRSVIYNWLAHIGE